MRGRALLPILVLFAALRAFGADGTLYRRLGGRESIRPIVSDFVDMLSRDQKLRLNSNARKFLDNVNPAELKGKLMDLVCEVAQGPCKAAMSRVYLKRVLQDIELTPFDWSAMEADFEAAMVKFKVAPADQDELRSLLKQAKLWTPPSSPLSQ